MYKISVIADSMTLPRKENNDVILYEDTWPYLLQKKMNEEVGETLVINFGLRERTSANLTEYELQEYVKFIEPNLVILQIGVVDAMPRIISKFEKKILQSFFVPPHLRYYIIENRKKNRQSITIKDPLNKVYVKPTEFSNNITNFINKTKEYNNNIAFIIIPILIDSTFFEKKSPGATSNIKLYNEILLNISKTTNQHFLNVPYSTIESSDFFCEDGYHLAKTGNWKIADSIFSFLSKNLLTSSIQN